ncbi:hypothetical protein GQR58_028094 [Nymphon striatum]|nr:hypothetical protein GQR58_028094 [Nymphon striatum]
MEERLEAYEMWIYRRIGKVSWTERKTNEYVLRMLGIKKQLLNIVKERKLKYYGHIKRHQTVQRITLEGKVEGKRSRGKQRLKWEDNIKGWTKRSMEEYLVKTPHFAEVVPNVTVTQGREAVLPCVVNDLGKYKASVAFNQSTNLNKLTAGCEYKYIYKVFKTNLNKSQQNLDKKQSKELKLIEVKKSSLVFPFSNHKKGRCSSCEVAWLHVEKKQVLTLHRNLITRNYRVTLDNRDHRHWILHIKDVQESDRGHYMCQINTSPMKNQVGFIQVVGALNKKKFLMFLPLAHS